MKDYLREIIRPAGSSFQARNMLREYLQARILSVFQKNGAMIPIAFHGETALRFLFSINRFSEDLDFALEKHAESFNFRYLLQAVVNELRPEGYPVELKINDRKTVYSAFVRFPGLLYEFGLSSMPGEVMAVKVEVDTNPPKGAGLSTTVVRKFVLLQLQHHDKASLFAGKLHAVLMRPYLKGRDIYDLQWYLSDPSWPAPNLEFLNHALQQTNWKGETLNEGNWKDRIIQRLRDFNWAGVIGDVEPFAEAGFDPDLLNLTVLEELLKG